MKNKQKSNKVPVWITYRSDVVNVVEDTLGDEGPYTGYREDDYDYELLNAYSFKPKDTYYYEEVAIEASKVPDNLHVVVVRYSTGDTFSRSNGRGCIAAAYEKYNDAEKAVKQIKNKTWKHYSSWSGFFERFESVSIKSLVIFKK